MKQISGGATIWARKTIDSVIFYDKPADWFKIWFFVVNEVNHTQYRKWKRGEGFMTYSQIMEKTKTTKNQVDMCFRFLKKEQMLTTRKTTRGMTIEVLNYDFYQELKNYKNETEPTGFGKKKGETSKMTDTETDTGTKEITSKDTTNRRQDNYKNDTENETETKQKRNRNDTINKNDKNDKNEKNNSTTSGASKNSTLISEIIKLFEMINPACKKMYNNTSQRNACVFLLEEFGFERVKKRITTVLPKSNGMDFFPTITTPCKLRDKWSDLEVAIKRHTSKQAEQNKKGKKIIIGL